MYTRFITILLLLATGAAAQRLDVNLGAGYNATQGRSFGQFSAGYENRYYIGLQQQIFATSTKPVGYTGVQAGYTFHTTDLWGQPTDKRVLQVLAGYHIAPMAMEDKQPFQHTWSVQAKAFFLRYFYASVQYIHQGWQASAGIYATIY